MKLSERVPVHGIFHSPALAFPGILGALAALKSEMRIVNSLLHKSHMVAPVRALLWAFGSPPLVTSKKDERWQPNEWYSWRALELASVLEDAAMAADLEAFLNAENDHRLGARFERLIEFGLAHLPDFDCVKRRLQVQFDGRTWGEFDFIVENRVARNLEHWEVACKFYLGVPDANHINWVGPGKRDSLIRKLRHLTHRQLVLSDAPQSLETRKSLGQELMRVRAMIKGRLFYPLGVDAIHDTSFRFDTPEGHIVLNEQAPIGYWCDFDDCLKAKPGSVRELTKSHWLDPEAGTGNADLTMEELEAQVARAPQCVDVVTQDGEPQRWFVVAPGWFSDLDPGSLV